MRAKHFTSYVYNACLRDTTENSCASRRPPMRHTTRCILLRPIVLVRHHFVYCEHWRDVAPDAVGPKKDARDCTSLKCFKNSGPSKHFRTPTKDGFSVESTKAMWTALGRARMLALKDARVACRIHLAPFTYSPFDQKQLTWSVQNGTLA